MPVRVRENGRHASAVSTRSASQPLMVPTVRQASVPPVIAIATCPLRTMWKACPIAWAPDAHALATVQPGPLSPRSIDIWLPAAFAIRRGTLNG